MDIQVVYLAISSKYSLTNTHCQNMPPVGILTSSGLIPDKYMQTFITLTETAYLTVSLAFPAFLLGTRIRVSVKCPLIKFNSSLCQPILAYSSIFQPMSAYFSRFQPIPAYSDHIC